MPAPRDPFTIFVLKDHEGYSGETCADSGLRADNLQKVTMPSGEVRALCPDCEIAIPIKPVRALGR